MPDAGASRKRQISGRRIPGRLTPPVTQSSRSSESLQLRPSPGSRICDTRVAKLGSDFFNRFRLRRRCGKNRFMSARAALALCVGHAISNCVSIRKNKAFCDFVAGAVRYCCCARSETSLRRYESLSSSSGAALLLLLVVPLPKAEARFVIWTVSFGGLLVAPGARFAANPRARRTKPPDAVHAQRSIRQMELIENRMIIQRLVTKTR